MACGVGCAVGVFVEAPDLFFVDGDGQDFFLFELVWVILIAFDDHESVIFMEFDFGWDEKDFGEEILLGEKYFVIGFLEFSAFISHRTYNNIQKTQLLPKSSVIFPSLLLIC